MSASVIGALLILRMGRYPDAAEPSLHRPTLRSEQRG